MQMMATPGVYVADGSYKDQPGFDVDYMWLESRASLYPLSY